jgi:hypothetical protein
VSVQRGNGKEKLEFNGIFISSILIVLCSNFIPYFASSTFLKGIFLEGMFLSKYFNGVLKKETKKTENV